MHYLLWLKWTTIFFILQEIELEKKVDALGLVVQQNEEKRVSTVLW